MEKCNNEICACYNEKKDDRCNRYFDLTICPGFMKETQPKVFKPIEVFEFIDRKWKWIAMDSNCEIWVYTTKPIINCMNYSSSNNDGCQIDGIISIDYSGIDWKDSLIEKIEVGMFGKFWDDDENKCSYGILHEIKTEYDGYKILKKMYKIKQSVYWDNFKPYKIEEIKE